MKLGRKRKGSDPDLVASGSRSQQNISVSGDALRQSAAVGLLIVLAVAVAMLVYVSLVRAPAQRDLLVSSISSAEAREQAEAVGAAIRAYFRRLETVAESDRVFEAVVSAEDQSLGVAENELLKLFPEALGLRIFRLGNLGTADVEAGMETLRNHIEVDLLRRVSNGERAQIEAYEHESRWMASLAHVVNVDGESSQRGALLLTLGGESINGLFAAPQESLGSYTLRQRIYGDTANREVDVVTVGAGLRDRAQRAPVADTHWHIEFSPSQTLIDEATRASRPAYGALLVLALAGLAATVYTMTGLKRALAADSQRIVDAAQHRTPFSIRIPELAAIARDLRRSTLRGARTSAYMHVTGDRRGTTSTAALAGIEGPATAELPERIFRAYDIRGIAETELTDEIVFRIGCALATLAGELGEQTLYLAYDGRESSTRIRDIVEKALLRCGRDVIDIGLVPTPLLYFATHRSKDKSGIMITGSHSPAQYNGLKVVLQGRTLAEGDIERVRNIAQNGRFSRGKGHMIQESVVADYLDEIVSDIAIAVPLKVVVDAGNGATSYIAPDLLEELGCEVVPLNCEVNGSFPNRSPDTSNEKALEGLAHAVVANEADFGVAYDGDGDRLAVVTGSGRILRTDTLMMMLARDIVSRHPGADVVFDVKCSRNLGRMVTNLGGRPVLWKTGHALMKQKMVETGALLGGEFSGHIFYGERWYGFDDGMYATGRLAEILASVDQSLDQHIADLPVAFNTPELLVPVNDDKKFDVMERFIADAEFSGGKKNDLDGLRIDFENGWGLLRASNTGPNLTARFEASSEHALQQIQNDFHEQLAKIAPDLKIPF